MTVLCVNVNSSTDSFGQWITKTNQGLYAISSRAVTNGNTMVGNAAITGTFSSNNLITNTEFKLSVASSNVVANGAAIVMRSSPTTNTVYTANGFVIDGTVIYRSNLMQMGSTIIRPANVTSIGGYFQNEIVVGNTYIGRDRIRTDSANLYTIYVSNNATFGDTEANVFLNRDGLQIFANPSGFLQTNSRMTSTDLWIRNIHANTINTNSITITGPFTVNTFAANVSFLGNTYFGGQNNHFAYGLSSNSFVLIGPQLKVPYSTPQTAFLHIRHSVSTTSQGFNPKSTVVMESVDDNLFEFRTPPNTGKSSGIIFNSDSQAGYIVYSPPGTGSPAPDVLRMGAKSGIKLEIGGQTATTGVAVKTPILEVDSARAIISGALRLNGSTSGYAEIKAAAAAGSPSFTLPINVGTQGQYLQTDGTGTLQWNTVSAVPPPTANVECWSLGVGIPATGRRGEIVAYDDITAFSSSDRSLKTNVENIKDALSKVMQINGVTFDWTDEFIAERGGVDGTYVRKEDVGVIAQEVELVLPEVVATRDNGIKAVKYEKIVPLLIEAIKDLKAEIEELKKNSCGCKK